MARERDPFVLSKHAPPLMAIFAEAVEWATSQQSIATPPPGHIAVEPRTRGGRYAYWVRYDPSGKLKREYLGPEGSEAHLEGVARLEGQKRIKEQAKHLRQLGFQAVEHDAARVIAELCNAGIFVGGGVLIGTRAFSSILNHLGYKATPFLGTQDVDIARFTAIKLAAPLPQGGFIELLRKTGLRFAPVLGLERPPGPPTSYKVIGKPLKVDLLVPGRMSSKPYAVVPVPELDGHATTLPFLDYLIGAQWQTIVIGRDHLIPVRCPEPARYCFHKLLVANLRSGLENPKIEKDLIQAGILAAILAEEDPGALEEAAAAMTTAMARHVKKSLPRLDKVLANAYPAAADLIHRLSGF